MKQRARRLADAPAKERDVPRSGRVHIGLFPDEMLCAVFSFVSCCRDRIAASRVCRRWHAVLTPALGEPPCRSASDALRRDHASCFMAFEPGPWLRNGTRHRSTECIYRGAMSCLCRVCEIDPIPPYCDNDCGIAAERGRFDMVKVLRETGRRLDKRTLKAAAAFGDPDIVQWCRANEGTGLPAAGV